MPQLYKYRKWSIKKKKSKKPLDFEEKKETSWFKKEEKQDRFKNDYIDKYLKTASRLNSEKKQEFVESNP